MKGILLKDLYECVCIRKNQLNWIATIALVLILTFVFRTTYVFLLNVMITAPLAGSCAYQFPMEQDEIVNFSKIQMTYPITKKEFILERFLLTLGFIGVSGVFSLILTMVYTYGYRLAALSTTLPVWGMGICFALIFFSVSNVFYLGLGVKAGTVLFILLILAAAFGYILTSVNFGVQTLLYMDKTFWLLILIAGAVLCLIASYLISIKIYEAKHA